MRRMLFVSRRRRSSACCSSPGRRGRTASSIPDQAGTGNVVRCSSPVENEQSDAGTTQVQLFFPEGVPITLVDLPAVAGWTTAVEGGAIGSPVTSVTWSRPTATPDENPLLPLTIGPMPADPVRLQFKALQTYSNGEVERWIEDWPAGAPEPDHPAPVLEVVTGGPGTRAGRPRTTVADVGRDDHDTDDGGDDRVDARPRRTRTRATTTSSNVGADRRRDRGRRRRSPRSSASCSGGVRNARRRRRPPDDASTRTRPRPPRSHRLMADAAMRAMRICCGSSAARRSCRGFADIRCARSRRRPGVTATTLAPRRSAVRPWTTRLWAALAGLLAAALALGVGDLFAGLFRDAQSPRDAVGAEFIDHTPIWLKNYAVEQFGTNDKVALRVGMLIVIGLLGLVLGAVGVAAALGRRRRHRRVRSHRRLHRRAAADRSRDRRVPADGRRAGAGSSRCSSCSTACKRIPRRARERAAAA